MESKSEVGKINISGNTYQLVQITLLVIIAGKFKQNIRVK
jgi:hypothetical protein